MPGLYSKLDSFIERMMMIDNVDNDYDENDDDYDVDGDDDDDI